MRVLLVLVLLTAATAQAQDVPSLTSEIFSATVERPVTLRYLLSLPDGYADPDSPGASWPLVLFLHGAGERGDDVSRVAIHGPARRVREGHRFPFILVSPQAPEGTWWDARELGALLDDIQMRYRVDPDRVYVTGLSMGGFGTWSLLETFPDRFAAAVPICGGGTPVRICDAKKVPVWTFHGALDPVVSIQRTQEMVDRLVACGGDVRFTVYPETGHDSWTETYANPDVYAWLLSHRRGESR